MTRITHRSIQESTLANLQRNLSAMNTLQEQLSTQKRINRASDDPTGTVNVLQLRADLRATEQHGRNADDGIAWLTETESALTTTSSQLRVVTDRTLQALNTGSQSPEGLAAIALEVEGVRDTLVSMANKQYLGRSVFAGTAAGPAVTRSGAGVYDWASTGSGTVERQISSDTKVRVDTVGADVFGVDDPLTNTGSVFTLLDRISDQIRSRDPALNDSLGELKARYDTVTGALANIGARYGRVADAQEGAEDRRLSLTTSLSEVESIDLPATIVQLQSQEVAYKAALGATAKVLQPSLMDFLR